jgi:hypothetical protein
MAGLAGFLSGTVSESLKKLVLPAGIVPATIFTLLNLAFVYPPARDANVGVAKEYAALSAGWQLAVITTLVFVLGYLLVNLAPTAVATLAGDTWQGSALHLLLSRHQEAVRRRLSHRADHAQDGAEALALRMQLASRFALPTGDIETAPIDPTRLGNVVRAAQSQVYRRWGIDITTLWSPLESASSVKDSPAMQTAADEKATLQLMANLVLIALAFAIEAFAFDALHHRWQAGTAALLLLAGAYVCYRIAVGQARSWADAVEVAIDVHRDDLRKTLGLRDVTSVADERQQWRNASAFYRPSPDEPAPGDLFDATSVPGVLTSSSAGVEAKLVKSEVFVASPLNETSNAVLVFVRYLILVSRRGRADSDPQAAVVVSDPRVRVATAPAKEEQGPVTAEAVIANDGSSLIWQVSGLDRGDAIALDYKLPLWRLQVTGGKAAIHDRGTTGLRLDLSNSGEKTIKVTSYLAQASIPQLLVENKPCGPTRAERGVYEWKVSATSAWLLIPETPT